MTKREMLKARVVTVLIVTCCALFLVSLGGCGATPQGDAVRAAVKSYGSQAFDEGLENAEWFICDGASAGSIKRRYGRSMALWAAFCNQIPMAAPGPEIAPVAQ